MGQASDWGGVRHALRHAQLLIALYTKLDAECDQQATGVGRHNNWPLTDRRKLTDRQASPRNVSR